MEKEGGVQTSPSPDRYPNPQKIFFAPKTGNHADISPPEGDVPKSIPHPTIVIPNPLPPSTIRSQIPDYIMKPHEGSPPPLSSSDVLMNSFNVLEDGDPVRHYEMHDRQGTSPGEHDDHPHEYPASSVSSVAWTGGRLEHNSNSILRALREPQDPSDMEPPLLKNMSRQAVYTTSINQRPLPTARIGAQWSQIEEENHQPNSQYTHSSPTPTIQDLSNPTYLQQLKTSSPPVGETLINATSQGTLTKAVKETFFVAHFSCTHCPEKFRIPERLAEHIKSVHSGSIVYTCFTCGRRYFNSYDLREHVASHADDPIKCSLCSLILSSSKELRNHHKTMHPMSSISCPLCEKIFASTSARAKHLAIEHKNDGQLTVCDLCGDAFLDKALYEEHSKTHQSASGVSQPSKGLQESNVSKVPMTVIIWKCDKCGIIFPNDKELAGHKETMHRDDICPKQTITQAIQAAAQGKTHLLKPATSDLGSTRYELLRLLLARRMASSSKTSASGSSTPNLSAVGLDLDANTLLSMKPPQVVSNNEMQQPGNELQQVTTGFNRGPGILSAETMQHVADELSMLEQTMDKKKRQVDAFLTNKSLSVTADMMIDSESTIGINLAIKKNTSQDINLQEIHKQKTLVNRLQGTVASIIEKEVKHTKAPENVVWNIDPVQMDNVNHNDNNHHYIAEYESKHPYIKTDEKLHENNNMIYENRNFCTSFAPESHQVDATYVTAANVLPCSSDRIAPQANTYTCSSMASASPNIHDGQAPYEMTPQDGLSARYNKATSPWDDHIEPLLKLFQNVGSSPIEKEQKTNDADSQYLLPPFPKTAVHRENILDLSSSHQNVYTSSHDNVIHQERTQESDQLQEHSASAKLPSFMTLTSAKHGLRDTLGYSQETTNIPIQTNAQLPHFNDITWSKLKDQMDERDNAKPQMQTSVANSDYKVFAQPSSSLNQMSGGQFHYAVLKKTEEDPYYGQNTNDTVFHEKLEPDSSIHVQPSVSQHHQQSHHQQHQEQRQEQTENYEYKGIPQHEQPFQAEQDHVQHSQQSQQENQQMQNYKSFMSEGPSQYERRQLHSPRRQHASFTPSPTGHEVSKSNYTDLTPVQLPIHAYQSSPLSPPMQDMQHPPSMENNQVPQNYIALLRQTSYSPGQQQLQQQPCDSIQSPVLQYEETNAKQTIDKVYEKPAVRCVSQKVTEAITHYLNGRNTHLFKKTIPEVPLVIRHKLLASILTDEDKEATESSQNQPSTNHMQPQHTLPNTDGPLLLLRSERQSHSMSSPLLYGTSHCDANTFEESRAHHSTNQTYSQPSYSTIPNASNHVNRTLSQQDISTMATPGPAVHRTLSQPNTSTIDNELLKQIMPSQLPVPVPMPGMTSPIRQPMNMPRWPTHVTLESGIPRFDSRMYQQNNSRKMFPQSPTKVPRVNKRKRRFMGPACQKRQVVIIIQKADDEYYMGTNTHVNLTLPKRSHTCVERGCLNAKSDALPQQRMRGRPPKNGSLVARKGSYKKGRYPCPVCGNFYAWKNYLRIHIAKHAKKVVSSEGANSLNEKLDLKGEGEGK